MTASTAQPRRSERTRRRKRRPRIAEAAISLVLAAALLGLAVPRTVAAWSSLQALPAFEALWAGKSPGTDALAAAAAGLTSAVAAAPSGERLIKLAEIEATQAGGAGLDKAARVELLVKAEKHLIDALQINPVQTFGWLDLAKVRIARGARERDIVVPLMHAVEMAPNMRLAWIPRAELLLRYWQFLDIEELPEFSTQIRTIWSASPAYRTQLVETAIGADEMAVVAAVVSDPPPTAAALREMQSRKALRFPSR